MVGKANASIVAAKQTMATHATNRLVTNAVPGLVFPCDEVDTKVRSRHIDITPSHSAHHNRFLAPGQLAHVPYARSGLSMNQTYAIIAIMPRMAT